MRRAMPLLLLASTVAVPLSAQQVEVTSAGSEPALRLDKVTLARPFGAMLVDRLAIVSNQRVGGVGYTLVRGDAAGPCPSRFVLVARAPGDEPRVTEPFGTCAGNARLAAVAGAAEVSMPATATGGPPVRFRFDGGAMRLIDAMPAATGSTAVAGYGPRAASSCRAADTTDAATQQAVIDDFERSYPAEYRRARDLRRAEISPDEMRATVTGLACLATWPGAEDVVPKAATPLFASKRHGDDAFAALEAIAQDPLADANLRASVRAFAAEMTFRVERREPL